MNFQFYIEKLHDSEEFKDFMLENPDAYMCSGFFIMDYEKGDHKQHLDFYSPTLKKVFSFKLEKGVTKEELETYSETISKKLLLGYDFDLDEIEKMILERMSQEKVNKKIQKILLSLQRVSGKDVIVGTVFVSGLGMLKTNIDPVAGKILDFEKKSFFDMVKIIRKK